MEINGQRFGVGDTVRFPNATLPANRTRDYQITAASAAAITVTTGEFTYRHTRTDAERLGIIHAPARYDR